VRDTERSTVKKDELAGKTLPELRDLARSRGLTGVSKLKKADLIDGLLEVAGRKPRKVPATRGARSKAGIGKKRTKPGARRKVAAGRAAAESTARPGAGTSKRPAKRAVRAKATPKRAPKPTAPARKRPAKRPPDSDSVARGLSPRTRRAFTAYKPLGEQRVKASKYYLGVQDSPELDEGFAYPETYGENAITLMVRDPYWLFTYWEFAPELRADLVKRMGEEALLASRLVLRVYDVTGVDPDHANEYRDIDVAPGARNWYINVMRVEREYCVDVGLITPDGSFVVIARSNRVTLPPVGPSDVVDEEWVTIESLEEVYRQAERGPTSGSGGWGSGGWGSGGWRQ
jgi:hypothetical protein